MCFACQITEARREIHTHNFISRGRNGYTNTLQWYVTRPFPVFFLIRYMNFRLFRWCTWRFRSSGLWRCVSVYVDPGGSSKYNVQNYNNFNPWKWKQEAASKFKNLFTHWLLYQSAERNYTWTTTETPEVSHMYNVVTWSRRKPQHCKFTWDKACSNFFLIFSTL
jgi:hypothetical protein